MAEIIPAILEVTFPPIEEKLATLVGYVQTVQIDVCDGVFVPTVSWPYTSAMVEGSPKHYDAFFKQIVEGEGEVDMPMWEDFGFELDLMIADVPRLLPDLLTIGPSRIVLHAEAFVDLYSDIHMIAKKVPPVVELGIAINAGTNPEILFKLLDDKIVSFVQCMGIAKIGYQGQEQDERVYLNLEVLRQKYPNLELSVDGAVDLKDVQKLVDSGATRLVTGSAIFSNGRPRDRVAEFQRVIQ